MADSTSQSPRKGSAAEALLLRVAAEPSQTWEFVPTDPEGPDLRLTIRNGRLEDLARASGDSLLSRALLGSLRDRERRRLEKRASDAGEDPGLRAFHDRWVPQEEAVELVQGRIDADLAELLAAGSGRWLKIDSTPLADGLCGVLHLQVPLEDALLFAARRHNLWQEARSLPIMRDVLSATPRALPLLSDPDLPGELRSLLEAIDGRSDIAELVENSTNEPWHRFDQVMALLEEGITDVLSPMELFQLGAEMERDGNSLEALRRFTRSSERGLDDFDIDLRIANLRQKLGDISEARLLFLAFAEKCTAQFRVNDTIGAYEKVLELDPEDRDTTDRLIELVGRHGKGEEAHRVGMELSRRLLEKGDAALADSLLENLASRGELDEAMLRLHLEIRRDLGDEDASSEVASRLGSLLHSQGEFNSALEVVEERIAAGESSAGLLARRIELALQVGDPSKAVDTLLELTAVDGWSCDAPGEEAWTRLSALSEADMLPTEILEWIATAAESRADGTTAADVLGRLQSRASKSEEAEAALEFARRRQAHLVGDTEAIVSLARLERCHGNSREAAAILEDALGKLETGSEDEEQLVAELIATDPLHLQGNLLLARKENAKLPQVLRSSLLQMLSGDLQGATGTLARETSASSLSGLLESLDALLSLDSDRLFEAAEGAADAGNRGLLSLFLELIEDDNDPRLAPLRQRLEGDEAREEAARRTEGGVKVVSSGIQAITERLRGLQGVGAEVPSVTPPSKEMTVAKGTDEGADAEAAAEPGPPKPVAGGINAALERLRNLRGAEGTADSPTPPSSSQEKADSGEKSPPEKPVEHPEPTASAGIASAAARLGSLRTSPQD